MTFQVLLSVFFMSWQKMWSYWNLSDPHLRLFEPSLWFWLEEQVTIETLLFTPGNTYPAISFTPASELCRCAEKNDVSPQENGRVTGPELDLTGWTQNHINETNKATLPGVHGKTLLTVLCFCCDQSSASVADWSAWLESLRHLSIPCHCCLSQSNNLLSTVFHLPNYVCSVSVL